VVISSIFNIFYYSKRQGVLNDCWVIAAITILGIDAPEYIRKMFKSIDIEHGKYTVKIYSNETEKILDLDDYFPCSIAPVFS